MVQEHFYNDLENTVETLFTKPGELQMLDDVKDILDRIHIPKIYATHIVKYYLSRYKGNNSKAIVLSMYKVLNDFAFNISLRDLLNVMGLSRQGTFKTQKQNENVFLETAEMIEKYCKEIELTYKDMTVIKERIKCLPPSGHTPLTIIAGNIYLYCKSIKKKISLKRIAKITQISVISVQRYIKHYYNAPTHRR